MSLQCGESEVTKSIHIRAIHLPGCRDHIDRHKVFMHTLLSGGHNTKAPPQADNALQAPERPVVENHQVTLSQTGARAHFSHENDSSVVCIFKGVLS